MFKNSLHLFSFLFLFLTTLKAIPSHSEASFNLGEPPHFLETPSKNSAVITAENRRRSSLCSLDSRRSSSQFPTERKSLANSEGEGVATDDPFCDHDSSSSESFFKSQMEAYDTAIKTASEEFYDLAEEIEHPTSKAETAFIADESMIERNSDSSLEKINQNSTYSSPSPSPNESLHLEDSYEKPTSSQLDALTKAKEDVVSNTYWYTTTLLEKVVSLEFQNPLDAAAYWEDLVKKTNNLIKLLEKHKRIWTKYHSTDTETLDDLGSEISFYQARLAEYEAEEGSTSVTLAHNNYLSPNESSSDEIKNPQDHIRQGIELVAKSAKMPIEFHHAADTYRAICQHGEENDITALYEIMALWCEARAVEMSIGAVNHTALVYKTDLASESLLTKGQKAYADVITACETLLPKFAEDETEQLEVTRYLNEAMTKKQFLEAQFQERKIAHLISDKSASNLREDVTFSNYENLFRELQSFQTLSQAGLREAPERFKSVWTEFSNSNVPALIDSTTENLKQTILSLIEKAEIQSNKFNELRKGDNASAIPTSTLIKESRSTVEKYKLALKFVTLLEEYYSGNLQIERNKPSDLLLEKQSSNTLEHQKYYWLAVSAKLKSDDYNNKAIAWMKPSEEISDESKSILLERAHEQIMKACKYSKMFSESIRRIDGDKHLPPLMNSNESKEYKNKLAATREKIEAALEKSREPSWTAWFCSFFKIPQWVYFWRTPSTV